MELADLEYFYLIKEMNSLLKGCKVGKVYQITSTLFKMVFTSKDGRYTLIFQLPDYITVTKRDIPSPQKPSNFTMALRKRIENATVTNVEQPDFERIVIFNLDVRGSTCKMLIELFSNGNIVFCDANGIIDLVYRSESWRDRELKKGITYKLPPTKRSPLSIDESCVSLNGKKTLMSGILSMVSLSPKYLEEALLRAGVDPKSKDEPDEVVKRKVVEKVKEVCSEGRFFVYKKDGKLVNYSVCALSKYEIGYEREEYGSCLEMVDLFYEPNLEIRSEEEDSKRKVMLEKMKERLAELEREAIFCKEAGDWIYEKYTQLESAVSLIRRWKSEGKSDKEINNLLMEINPNLSFENNVLKIRK